MGTDAAKAAMIAVHKAGHRVENHAWSHDDLEPMPLEQVRREIGLTQDLIEKTIGRAPTRLRPPYGAGALGNDRDPELFQVVAELDLTVTLWQVDSRDWEAPKGLAPKIDKIMNDVASSKHRALTDILMHVLPNTANDLDGLITLLKSEGYSFG